MVSNFGKWVWPVAWDRAHWNTSEIGGKVLVLDLGAFHKIRIPFIWSLKQEKITYDVHICLTQQGVASYHFIIIKLHTCLSCFLILQ